jgi:hypothetical protein
MTRVVLLALLAYIFHNGLSLILVSLQPRVLSHNRPQTDRRPQIADWI